MKKISLLFAAVCCALAINATTIYKKVTNTPKDWTGTYLIVCESEGVVFNGGASEDNIDAKQGPAILSGFTFEGDSLIGSQKVDTATFTIAATDDEDWPWSIQSQSGLFIGHKDTADNGLSAELELKEKCKHTLTINENSCLIATPKHDVAGAYNLQYNKKKEQLRFRYFEPEDKEAIQIYKLIDDPTGLQTINGIEATGKKVVVNGQLCIIKDGKTYNALGKQL